MAHFLQLLSFSTALLAFCAWTTAASAQSSPLPTPDLRTLVENPFFRLVIQSETKQSVAKRILDDFKELDTDKDGILTTADADAYARSAYARFRARLIVSILRADLDGDGVVTKDEMMSFRPRPLHGSVTRGHIYEREFEKSMDEAMTGDADGDGTLSLQEIADYAARRASELQRLHKRQFAVAFDRFAAFDLDGDGRVTSQEVDRTIELMSQLVDTDGDGQYSRQEVEAFRIRLRSHRDAACRMPPASPESEVILLGAWRGGAISSIALDSQDTVTTAGLISVEPGSRPIYLVVVTSWPTIWRITGAVDRIERVVLTSTHWEVEHLRHSPPSTIGVAGIPASRVTLHPKCFLEWLPNSIPLSDAAIFAAPVKRLLQRQPDLAKGGQLIVEEFSIPSGAVRGQTPAQISFLDGRITATLDGKTEIIAERGPALLGRLMQIYYPRGVIDLDPSQIVSSMRTERYEVLPEFAGVLQLLGSGAITAAQNDPYYLNYLIQRKTRLPPGLLEHFGIGFVLKRGVPDPDGGRISMYGFIIDGVAIISEETGERIR